MNIIKVFYRYSRFAQALSPKIQKWYSRLPLLITFIFPGVPQLFKREQFFKGGILFFFGTGALFSLLISLVISGSWIKAFDIYYMIVVPRWLSAFPWYITSPESPDKWIPILPEGELVLTQPFFWEFLFGYILMYVICAGLSFWLEWKQKNA